MDRPFYNYKHENVNGTLQWKCYRFSVFFFFCFNETTILIAHSAKIYTQVLLSNASR